MFSKYNVKNCKDFCELKVKINIIQNRFKLWKYLPNMLNTSQ